MATMKVRAIVLIDYTVDGFETAAKEHTKIKNGIESLVQGNPNVERWQSDLRERRGKDMPDISKIKVRM